MTVSSPIRSLSFCALLVALAMNLLNLWKPLTVDDVCHEYYASQVARDPLHPFEFSIVWHQAVDRGWDVMVAPVNSYYWAPAIALFGDSPLAWHLWYLPLQWLFCYSLMLVLRRFARGQEVALGTMFALGPCVLPGINLMLEVPMLSFGLASLAMLLGSFDRRSARWALGAGVLLGIALQTKYSALGMLGPWVLVTWLRRRPREFAIAFATAAALALSIEGLLAWSHGGGSYFWRQVQRTHQRDWPHVLRGMFLQVGGLGVPTTLMGLYALRARTWLVVTVAVVFVICYGVVASGAGNSGAGLVAMAPDSVAYLVIGLCTWATIAAVWWRLLEAPLSRLLRQRALGAVGRLRLVIGVWLFSELAASLALSPFPAARRSMLVVMVFMLGVGWLASRTRRHAPGVARFAALSVALGLGYQAVDYLEGFACIRAIEGTVARAKAIDPDAKIYYTGGWSCEFYAPRRGMQNFVEGVTVLQPGDFVAVGSIDGIEAPWFEDDPRLPQVAEIDAGDGVPFSTWIGYYSGRRPLDHQIGPRYRIWLHRAAEVVPAASLRVRADPFPRGQ